MDYPGELTANQVELLRRVSHGEFSNAASVPDDLGFLAAHGYVALTPTVLFPVIPSRHNYRLTSLGEKALHPENEK